MKRQARFLKYLIIGLLLMVVTGLLNETDVFARSLRIGLLRAPLTLNYFAGTDIWSKRILRFFHMPLYVHEPGTNRMTPWLAKSLPLVSPNKKEVTVQLKKAYWSDGTQITSEDICFTVEIIKKFQIPSLIEKWQMVEKAVPVDDKTVLFKLRYPSAVFFNRTLFCAFAQKKSWFSMVQSLDQNSETSSNLITGLKPKNFISNGPFYITKYAEPFYIVLKQNPLFFAKQMNIGSLHIGPFLSSILLKFYKTTEEALVSLEKGKIDFLWWEIPDDWIPELKNNQKIKLFRTIRKGYDYLGFNLEKEPFGDIAFRKAIAYLIDREEILRNALKNDGMVSISPVPPYNKYWFNPHVWRPQKGLSRNERIEKAKQILRKAGYSLEGTKLILPNKKPMKTVKILTTCAGCKPHRFQAAVMIKRWCSDIGIPVELKMMNIQKILYLLKKGTFDAYILGWSHLPRDPSYLETFFHSREAKKGGKNYPRFRNSTFDKLCELANKEMDTAKRKKIIFQMQNIIARELPYITLYSKNRIEAVRTDWFQGWLPLPGGIGNLWSFLNLKPAN